MTILYLVPFTLLFVGDRVRSEDNGLILEGIVCEASNDPCPECYACSEFGRCVQIMGCMPSEEEPPADSAPEEVQDLPGLEDGDDGVDEVESSPIEASPVDDAPVDQSPIDEAPINEVESSPESPVDASPVDEVPVVEAPVQESPVEVVDASPESPVDEAQDEGEDE